jgi:hypothetical protein
VIIPAKSVFQTHKTLGHHKAPAGKNTTQLRILKANSDVFSKLVATSPCNRTDSWFFYSAIYLKSIGYILPNCFYDKRELTKVQQSALRAFLAKCGFNRNTACAIVFAPICYGGCGFFSLYLIQGEGQILQFLTHWRTNTTAGNLLRIAVSWVQLHLGISWFCLGDTTTPLPHFPGRWLKSLRQFLSQINGTLEVDDFFLPPLQRANDVYVMDMVLASDKFSTKEVCLINYCRMYLQAVTVADLCLPDGVSLDPSFLTGNPTSTSSTSKWIHINQARPSEPCWRLWRRACAMWSHKSQLHFPLGPWTQPDDQLRRSWPHYYDRANGEFYIRNLSGYKRCVSIDPVRFSPISQLDWQPTPTSIPVHARMSLNGVHWIPIIPYVVPILPTPPPIATSFSDFISFLDEWETELFADLTMNVDCYEFIRLVETQKVRNTHGQLITVSDGSDNAGAMTFGWTISLPDGTCLAQCAGPAYGPFGTSFRAEGYGFLSVSRFLLRLHEYCGIQPAWCVQLMTDNLGLLTRIEQ